MEYFDFDRASYGSHSQAQDDDVASDHIEVDGNEVTANCDSLAQEQSLEFPNDLPEQDEPQQVNDIAGSALEREAFPMSRAKDPCDFCRRMGFDCFVANRGVMQNGCTCCISLYRQCSFTHAKKPGKFLDTLHTVTENVDIPTGGLTGKKALKSLPGATFSEDLDSQGRKSSSRLSREAVRILKTWLYEHSQHPYPTEQEKDELEQRTGLKRAQVSNWLANARRRGKVRPTPRSSSPVPGAVDIPARQQHPDVSLMTPLERWKHSPPENEPAATSDILRALVNTSFDSAKPRSSHLSHVRSLSRKTGSSNDSSQTNSNMLQPPSVSSFETSRSSLSDFSFASAFSHRSSKGSFGSMDKKEQRRRRRKPSVPVNAFNQQKARSSRIFQCTFCTDSFPTKYDWQRHEKSLHLALDKWTCSPLGGVVSVQGINRCVFCMAADPDNDHLETHNYSTCQEKTLQERTFYRKDHLNQHLRLMHNVKFHPSMDNWQSGTTEIKSRCGFCATNLTTWKERVEHLAAHFKDGANMAQWQGDWGFEPFVQSLVENAMPPYLIDQEYKTLAPFKPSHAIRQPCDIPKNPAFGIEVPHDADCFDRLQRQLTSFINDHVAMGIIPTDKMIQDEARKVIYGNDDPWNQTCADNPVWLSILKRDTGLEIVPNSDHIQFDNLGMQPPFAVHGGLRRPPIETNPIARSVCSDQLYSHGFHSSGYQSPALPGTGRSSAAPSMPGSSTGSYVGSAGVFPTLPASGLSTDRGSSLSAGFLSLSTPASSSVDPLIQMGFDPVFLQHLNEGYDALNPDAMEGLTFEEGGGHEGGQDDVGKMPDSIVPGSAPISIPSPKYTGFLGSEPTQDLRPFSNADYPDPSGT
ncbi:hypothetical protein ASPWEDRAFT_110288 [Aspergillus wentii DTO 134E9]|uniref:Homeobox and C2H2 transcription factor n=1 Tax=Aspergillus wentii DTO 134E9 TaxID=1073089 RepID=A0A1L9RJ09_ASPWE|nr:uncharacterized protein ASPWEDRAFT_110288 [Aspergillus wentii DTO 134E9]KAI9932160.1 hypothetical protein MW887_009669 [Aspergillus wentii]OJJ34881.1 hypothetical protein ASPWEDRAFT_110288 [Aspergillus wentii DTO 134E9]